MNPNLVDGYVLSNHVMLGADLRLNFNRLNTNFTLAQTDFTSNSFSASFNPFIRYYPRNPEKKIQPYLELSGNWSYAQTVLKEDNPNTPIFLRDLSASIGGGVDFFLSENVALEAALSFRRSQGQSLANLELGFKFFLSGKQ